MVERFNRTLKQRIERYFTETKSHRWIDILSDFSNNINHTVNRTIGIEPARVTLDNADSIWKKLYPKQGLNVKCDKIKVGDRVRTVLPRNIFTKGYHQAWSDELYTVNNIIKSMGTCLYVLKNDDGIILTRKYYLLELNFVSRHVS